MRFEKLDSFCGYDVSLSSLFVFDFLMLRQVKQVEGFETGGFLTGYGAFLDLLQAGYGLTDGLGLETGRFMQVLAVSFGLGKFLFC